MITSYLQGGLGNQMFQIAAAENLAHKNNDVAEFNFNDCHTPLQGNTASKYKNTFFKNFTHNSNLKIDSVKGERGHAYTPIFFDKDKDIKLIGYFQSEKYFQEYPEVIDKFYFDESIKKRVDSYLNSLPGIKIGVHVRRGDYLNNPKIHPTMTVDYYEYAMNGMMDMLNIYPDKVRFWEKISFIFVSDNMRWVRQNIIGPGIYYSEFTEELDDLYLLSQCDHNIIANSSFSWWGAYLNKNLDKKVFAPINWFGPNGPKDYQDIVPSSWEKI